MIARPAIALRTDAEIGDPSGFSIFQEFSPAQCCELRHLFLRLSLRYGFRSSAARRARAISGVLCAGTEITAWQPSHTPARIFLATPRTSLKGTSRRLKVVPVMP